jgi:flagellar hook-associated protein 1 FlgK
MSGLFGTLGTARSALYASQLAIQTTANNVANAATPGHSRQRVDLVASVPETLPAGQMGTGVSVDGIRRLRDQFLDQQFARAKQALGEHEAEQATLRQIEALLGEPSEVGMQASLSRFFASLQDLASQPTDLTTRRSVVEQARILAGDFNRLSTGLSGLKRNLESEIQTRVSDVNTLLQEVAALNGQIQTVTVAGGSPNVLQDRRDKLLDDLAKLLDITRVQRPDGTVQISLAGGGGVLVNAGTAGTLGAQLAMGLDEYQLTLDGTVVTAAGGQFAGLLRSRNETGDYVKFAETQLNSMASALIERMNRLQADGAGIVGLGTATSQNPASDATVPLGSAGLPFEVSAGTVRIFVYDASADTVTASGTLTITAATTLNDLAGQLGGLPGLSASVSAGRLTVTAAAGSTFRFGSDATNVLTALGLNAFFTGTSAQNVAVNEALVSDPRLVSAAAPASITGQVGAGDNSRALAMAGLRQETILSGGTTTIQDFYASTIGVLGARTAAMNRLVESDELVAQAVQHQREQVSGVSLNEEMAELIRFQHAFEASARMIRVVDELLDVVVNRMGIS